MAKYEFKGTSDGQVGSDDCGTCEHCGDLNQGMKWYADTDSLIYWCQDCLDSVMEHDDSIYIPPEKEEPIDNREMVATLVKDPGLILRQLTEGQVDLWHAATGVSGEAGELLDAVKKWCVYQKDLDRENVMEELGDLEFYMEALRQRMGFTREETLQHNIAKLSVRYKGFKYTDQQAHDRADKEDGN